MEAEQRMNQKTKRTEGLKNEMHISFDAISINEAFARITVAAFVAPLDPTLEEISDIKTAVSEAVTNAIIHGYDGFMGTEKKQVHMDCMILEDVLQIVVKDEGIGIADVDKAMQPLFTTKPELDRSGMGFAFMEAFMDDLEVESTPGNGTVVTMKKKIGTSSWLKYED